MKTDYILGKSKFDQATNTNNIHISRISLFGPNMLIHFYTPKTF